MALTENTNTKVTVGTSAGTLATLGPDTQFFQVYNGDATIAIHLSFDGTDATTSNYQVPAGATFTLDHPLAANSRKTVVSAIAAGSSNANVYVIDLGVS